MACTSAGKYDPDTNRYSCQVTGDDCMFMRPDSKACAEMFNEGPDSDDGEITLEEMNDLPVESVVGIPCRSCEGHEDHTKLQDGTWKCNNCGDVKDMNTD